MGRSRNVIRFYSGVLWSAFTFYPFAFLLTLAWGRGNSCKDQIASRDPDKGRKWPLIALDPTWHSSPSSLPRCLLQVLPERRAEPVLGQWASALACR